MPEPIIEVQNLSKLYELGTIGGRTLRESLERRWYRLRGKEHLLRKIGAKHQTIGPDHPQAGPRPNTMWALKDVSFEVKEGEVLGIIGRNGAGKSTLLKLLTRITEPTSGRALVYGRVASLLEVGTGFHPELTGRENIYLNGAVLGMKKAEVARKFDEIVAFSEVEQFIDTPVKRYSSGMYVRLAFAVAAHLDPEILLVDEVLAVGDAAFQKKCLGKMGDVAKGGRTVLFVSHNMPSVQALCGRALLLTEGALGEDGSSSSVVAAYLSRSEAREAADLKSLADRTGSGVLRFTGWSVRDDEFGDGRKVGCSHGCTFRLCYDSSANTRQLSNASVAVTLKDLFGQPLLAGSTHFKNCDFGSAPCTGAFLCRFDQMALLPGLYKVQLWCSIGGEPADYVQDAGDLEILPDNVFGTGRLPERKHGVFYLDHSWSVEDLGIGRETCAELQEL